LIPLLLLETSTSLWTICSTTWTRGFYWIRFESTIHTTLPWRDVSFM